MSGLLRLVVNPAAGHGRALRVLSAAVAALQATGTAFEVCQSASLEHARELAGGGARLGHAVVAVGGDGTVGALAGVVAAAGGTYGIIPAGRGNDLARVLGIPIEPAAAVAVLTCGRSRQVDLIGVSIPGWPDSVVAGSVYAGVPSVAGEIANASRWLTGPMVYPVAALRALARWQSASFRVECAALGPSEADSEVPADVLSTVSPAVPPAVSPAVHEFAGYAVVIANSAYFGAGMQVAPPALIDDGILDIVLMRHGPRLAFVRALMKIKDGSHVELPQISLERSAEITLTISRDLPAAADGEALPGAMPLPAGVPLRIRALPSALTILAPPPAPA